MSELKARTARSIADEEEMLELGADCPIEPAQVYLKSEADNVIAEKDKEIAELKAKIIKSKELADGIRCDIEKVKADAAETLALLEERNKQIGESKEEIHNLRRSLIVARHEVAKARGKKFSNKYRVKLKEAK